MHKNKHLFHPRIPCIPCIPRIPCLPCNVHARLAACACALLFLFLIAAIFPATASAQSSAGAPDLAALRQKAEQGDVAAQVRLGRLLNKTDANPDVRRDDAEAFKWFQKAAAQNNAEAQGALGRAYLDGKGVEKDEAKALEHIKLAAGQGYPKSMGDLAHMYAEGLGGLQKDADQSSKLFSQSFQKFQAGAVAGDAEAQYYLGAMYFVGAGADTNMAEAAKWFRKAAEQGIAAAQGNLGVMCLNGLGVSKDKAEAVKWNRKAAEQGDASGQNNLGVAYNTGQGVPKNAAEAVKWFRLAADQGAVEAQYNLGYMYEKGRGVPKDEAGAMNWYRKAAEQGHAYPDSFLKPGRMFPDFTARSITGQDVSTAQLRGKVVLVDFWATWCGPCVAEMPNVKTAYEKYHDKGFEVVGVSLDDSKTTLADFLKKRAIPWTQIRDGESGATPLAARYGIETIPSTYLLGADGKIIAKDLRGKALGQQLEKLLGK